MDGRFVIVSGFKDMTTFATNGTHSNSKTAEMHLFEMSSTIEFFDY